MGYDFLNELGIKEINSGAHSDHWIEEPGGEEIVSYSPIDGKPIAKIQTANEKTYEEIIKCNYQSFLKWRMIPAPKRGQLVRDIGDAFRKYKSSLGKLVTLEMGKILIEGEGEVQEMIDMADFAVGLSRQLCGSTMHSEREKHRMYEQYHPLGIIGIISAFNFPVAVWSWNSFIAAVCGDSMIWKPSSKTPLCGIAIQNIINPILKQHGVPGLMSLVIGSGRVVGEKLISDRRVPLISATGSCRMGRRIGEVVGKRLGKSLLELGGNNAVIVMDDANLELAVRAVLFGAVGTAGQRCTSTRRVLIHKSVFQTFVDRLTGAYGKISIGDPLDKNNLMGPLVDQDAVNTMQAAIQAIRDQEGEILYGGKVLEGSNFEGGCYAEPTIVKAKLEMEIMKEETFAPIVYLVEIDNMEQAIEIQNSVDQGLSSSVFTTNMLTAETFLSHEGSDCGIANVNIGTSGAEIGGAFGGEKDTGGGREAGSDAWKIYMRRQTNTLNWGTELPLAQGVKFDI